MTYIIQIVIILVLKFNCVFLIIDLNRMNSHISYQNFFNFQTSGDLNLAKRSLRLCLSSDASHGSALNNLAAISAQLGQYSKAKTYLTAAKAVFSNSEEVEKNIKLVTKYA